MAKHAQLKKDSRLGPYRIVKLIARGGMGEVYEAYEESLNRRVALKVINEEFADDEEIIKRFKREGQALARTQHPNIVSVFSFSKDQGFEYIAMEFIEGEPLDVFFKKQDVPFDMALSLLLQILSGTRALHESGVIHRDLKTKNIILCPNQLIKIVDLGVARLKHSEKTQLTRTGVMVGSIFYMAPELIMGIQPTVQSDIWAIGVILYEMLFGTRPFNGNSILNISDQIKSKEMQLTEEMKTSIPPEMIQIMLKMLQKDLGQRYSSIEEIQNDLQAFTRLEDSLSQPYKPATSSAIRTQSVVEEPPPVLPSDPTEMVDEDDFEEPVSSSAETLYEDHSEEDEYIQTKIEKPSFFRPFNVAVMILLLAIGYRFMPMEDGEVKAPPKLERDPNIPVEPTEIVERPIRKAPAIKSPSKVTKPRKQVRPAPVAKKKKITPRPRRVVPTSEDGFVSLDDLMGEDQGEENLNQKEAKGAPRLINPRVKVNLQLARGRNPSSAKGLFTNPPTLKWKPVPGAKNYEVEVAKDAEFNGIFDRLRTRGNSIKWTKADPGKSYWRVKAIGGEYSRSGVITALLPSPKFRQKVIRKTHKFTSPREFKEPKELSASWEPLVLAQRFRFVLSRDPSFKKTMSFFVDEPRVDFEIKKSGNYYARIAAVDNFDRAISSYSDPIKIQYKRELALETPSIVVPSKVHRVNFARDEQRIVAFGWKPVRHAKQYRLEIAYDRSFKKMYLTRNIAIPKFYLNRDFPKRDVYWRIRSEYDGYSSKWTPTRVIKFPNR